MSGQTRLVKVYQALYNEFGPQHWWPGDTPFEVMVGAILTQNTSWGNAEKAINNLKARDLLEPLKIKRMRRKKLSRLIRPCGYFNIKAERLKEFVDFFLFEFKGSVEKIKSRRKDVLRRRLLEIKGIGEETADSILLYAVDKPIFVVDAYTRRIFSRHNLFDKDSSYEEVQAFFMAHLPSRLALFKEFHALIVRLGKEFCRRVPECKRCPLRKFN